MALYFTEWNGGTTIKFKGQETSDGLAADTLVGMYVDMRNTPEIRVFIKTDVECNILFDIKDANGHVSSSHVSRNTINAGNGQYYTFSYPNDNTLFDWHSGDFWSVKNGRYSTSNLSVDGSTYTFDTITNIPFDLSKVVGYRLMINDGSKGLIDQPINIEMSDMTIGTVEKAVPFIRYQYDSPALVANPANVILAKCSWDMDNSKIPGNGNSTNPTDTLPEPYLSISDLLTPETIESARLIVADLSEMERIAISEELLETLLGEDITVIVSDSLVVWYYKADNGLKADASWEITGYGIDFTPTKYGIYMAEISKSDGTVVAITKQYTVVAKATSTETEISTVTISYSNETISVNTPCQIAVYSIGGICAKQEFGTELSVSGLPTGNYIVKASDSNYESDQMTISVQ